MLKTYTELFPYTYLPNHFDLMGLVVLKENFATILLVIKQMKYLDFVTLVLQTDFLTIAEVKDVFGAILEKNFNIKEKLSASRES